MHLNKPATADNIDDTTWEDICQWAKKYLPEASAYAFTHWLSVHLGDWENEDTTIHQVLTGAYHEWTGGEFPAPD